MGEDDVWAEEAVDATLASMISFWAITKVFLSVEYLSTPSLEGIYVITLSALKKEKCHGEGDEWMRR